MKHPIYRRTGFEKDVVRLGVITSVLLLLTLVLVGCPYIPLDCMWTGTAQAWLDVNQNGAMDEDEQPLSRIVFHIDDTRNNFQRVESRAVSDHEGKADLRVWLPGCPMVDFIVYSEAPFDYELTTAGRLAVRSHDPDEPFMFGYRYLPQATPTPRPEPVRLRCASFSIPYYDGGWSTPIVFAPSGDAWTIANNHTRRIIHLLPGVQRAQEYARDKDFLGFANAYDLARGRDGTLWLATASGVTQFDPLTDNWTSHIVDNGLHSEHAWQIAVLPSRDVLVITDAGLELLDAPSISWQVLLDKATLDAMGVSELRQRNHDALLIGDKRILRVWREAGSNKVAWEVLWETDQAPEPPVEEMYAITVENDNTIWLAGYSREQGHLITYLAPAAGTWVTFSYRSTGGAFGTEGITNIVIAADRSLWLNEHLHLIHGIPLNKERTQMQWLFYDALHLGLSRFAADMSIVDVAIAPDGALWFAREHRWFRCDLSFDDDSLPLPRVEEGSENQIGE